MDAPGKNAQSKAVADATTLNKPQPTPALKAKAAAKPRTPDAAPARGLPDNQLAPLSLKLQAAGLVSPARGLLFSSHWVFLTRQPKAYPSSDVRAVDWSRVDAIALPSDEKGSLLSLITFGAQGRAVTQAP